MEVLLNSMPTSNSARCVCDALLKLLRLQEYIHIIPIVVCTMVHGRYHPMAIAIHTIAESDWLTNACAAVLIPQLQAQLSLSGQCLLLFLEET